MNEISDDDFKKYFEPIVKKLSIKDRVLTELELSAIGFDITSCLSNNLSDFGISTKMDQIGQVVLYTGHMEINSIETKQTIKLNNTLGVIAAQAKW